MVMKTMKENVKNAVSLILTAIPMIAQEEWHSTFATLQVIMKPSKMYTWINTIPYSGKFSPGKTFAKPRCVVLRENFARFIFAHMRLGEIKFRGIINNYSFNTAV